MKSCSNCESLYHPKLDDIDEIECGNPMSTMFGYHVSRSQCCEFHRGLQTEKEEEETK